MISIRPQFFQHLQKLRYRGTTYTLSLLKIQLYTMCLNPNLEEYLYECDLD